MTPNELRREWVAFFEEGSERCRIGRPADWGLIASEMREAFAQRVRQVLAPLQGEGKLLMAGVFRFVPGADRGL